METSYGLGSTNRRPTPPQVALATALLSACAPAVRDSNHEGQTGAGSHGGGGADPDGTSDVTNTGASTDGDGGDTGGGDDSGGIKYDVGGADDATATGGDGTMGCEKIDFLFVVDNSGSMAARQTTLVNSFPAFMDTIFSTVKAQDYHIMVVDSDEGEDLGSCPTFCGGADPGSLGLDVACEQTLGAGEVAPLGYEASNMLCGVPNDERYLTSGLPQQEIEDKFACIARVGVSGSPAERPITAAVEAVTTQRNACNTGFLRDDAILVVTFITDDYPVDGISDDAGTNGDILQWRDAIVGAKSNDPSHVVVLGVINLANSWCVGDGSAGGGPAVHPSQKFIDFVDLFGARGITGDICATPDFSVFFQQAVGLIDQTCDDFVPPG